MTHAYANTFDKFVSDISELPREPELGHSMRKYFQFDDGWININQGSYGSHPKAVGAALAGFQAASERRPDEFVRITHPILIDKSRTAIAAHLHAPVEEIVFIPNATTGVDTVIRSLKYSPGDKIVFFDFIYKSCENILQYTEESTPVVGVKIAVTLPISDDELVTRLRETIQREQQSGARVRLALFDSIVSMPGIRLPFERLVGVCKELGVLSLIDGAHGVGHIPLDLGKLDADFFVSNCHKWLYVPRGCAVFHVPLRNQHLIRSTIPTSHGFFPAGTPDPPSGKSNFVTMFEFVGTVDASPPLCVPAALHFRAHVCGGEARIMAYCSALAKAGAELIAKHLGTEVMQRENDECCLHNVRLPITAVEGEAREGEAEVGREHWGVIRRWLMNTFQAEFNTAVPVIFYSGCWWIRVSGQVYLEISDFEFAARMIEEMCGRVGKKSYLGFK